MNDESIHISCPHCQTTNRVPVQRLDQDPVCGKCGKALLSGRPFELTDATFDVLTLNTDLPVLVDFWAAWCGPCKMMEPHFERAALQLKGKAMLAKVNSDENPRVAARFGIRSIPTLVKLQRGAEISRQSGAIQSAQIVAFAV